MIGPLIQSVRRQTIGEIEIIVVDNASTDETVEIAEGLGATVVPYHVQNFNYSEALNLGIAQASGDWVFIFSSHVEIPDARTFELMLSALDSEKHYGGYCCFNKPGRVGSGNSLEYTLVDFSRFDGFNGLRNYASVISRDLWLKMPFDLTIPSCEDQSWAYYHLKRGWSGVRFTIPAIVYKNPNYRWWKEARDHVVVHRYILDEVKFSKYLFQVLKRSVALMADVRVEDSLKYLYIGIVLVVDRIKPFKLKSSY